MLINKMFIGLSHKVQLLHISTYSSSDWPCLLADKHTVALIGSRPHLLLQFKCI